MKRLLALSLLAAAALAPTAAAKPITVATASAMVPYGGGVTVVQSFQKQPRAMYVVTTGPVGSVNTKVSCYPSATSSWPDVNKASYTHIRRIPLGYDHDAHLCTVSANAYAAHGAKHGQTIKIALEVVQ